MAATGHAAFSVMGRSIVVTVESDPLARGSLWIALAVFPAALVLRWASDEDTRLASSTVPATVSLLGSSLLGVLLVASLVRGTARARLWIENEPMDTIRWSTAPKRRLESKIDGQKIEAEVDTSGDREVRLFVDGQLLRTVKVV